MTSGSHNSAVITDRRKFISKWSLCGMSSFHFYRWNQFKIIPTVCALCTRKLPQKFFGVDAVSDATSRHATMSKWSFPSFPYSLLRGSQHCVSNRVSNSPLLFLTICSGTAYRYLFRVAGTDIEMSKSFNLHQTLYDSSTERFQLNTVGLLWPLHTSS